MGKKVAVVILNYNNWQDTLACAESVLAGEEPPAWLMIVDNASSNDSLRWIRHWAAGNMDFALKELGAPAIAPKPVFLSELDEKEAEASGAGEAFKLAGTSDENSFDPGEPRYGLGTKIFLIRKLSNKGYAAGNNSGLALALRLGADAVWILNNDTIVDSKALAAMRERLFYKKNAGLCGSLICYPGGEKVQCRAGGVINKWTGLSVLDGNRMDLNAALKESPDSVEKRLNFIYGASVMASREFIETVGLLDERYFLYCEEQDWAYSSGKRFNLAYAPDALVLHKEGGTTGFSHKKFNARSLWHIARSRMLLTCKHAPYALPTVILSMFYAAVRMAWRRLVVG